jgi:hypothetical protein
MRTTGRRLGAGLGGSLKETTKAELRVGSAAKNTGHDQCESNAATPLKASHPTPRLISD